MAIQLCCNFYKSAQKENSKQLFCLFIAIYKHADKRQPCYPIKVRTRL